MDYKVNSLMVFVSIYLDRIMMQYVRKKKNSVKKL